jgi:hypothetical protein
MAQQLADRLDAPVEAPSDTLWIWPDGETAIGPTLDDLSGDWVPFEPRGDI